MKSDSLQSEIIQVGNDFSCIVEAFGKDLYRANNLNLKISEMRKRLSDQRNHFAHGDLDKDFIGYSPLNLIFLQYLVYAMQLRYYGIPDDFFLKAINDLFQLRVQV